MNTTQRASLRELLRRIDEVRGLSERSERPATIDPTDPDALLRTLGELVHELERSHRRLIETNVQLVSLREVASRTMGTRDTDEMTRLVTRYLCRAFGFADGFLLVVDRESRRLEGTWNHVHGGRDTSHRIELPLLGDTGPIGNALWLDRTVVHHAPGRHPPAPLPDGHPLAEVFAGIGSFACVPLQRSHTVLPAGEPHELCGARCVLGDATVLAPPPGVDVDAWEAERRERQEGCVGCEVFPVLGVIGLALPAGGPALGATDVTLLESIALSVAPMVENARLYQELRKSERFRDHVLDSMASALVAVNMRGEILTFNHAAEDLLGHREKDVLGASFPALFGPDAHQLLGATLEHGHEVTRVETMLRTRDGSALPVSFTTSLLRNDRRSIYGAIATFVDLTPLKRAEEHARRQDRLAALGRFTSSVAHEIRNPLTGIAAGVQYLERAIGPDDPQREHLGFILSEITRLDRIVQDLFDITHPRALHLRPQPLADAARRAVQCVASLATERGVQVALVESPRIPPVPHDADQIEQVFINLVKNAVEASPSGSTVTVELQGPESEAPREAPGLGASLRGREEPPPKRGARPAVVARVADPGSGIDAEHLKTIFEPFFTTKPGGTGLGLYISHDIVKRHGGSLVVHSTPGHGTTALVELFLDVNGGDR